MHTLTTIIKLQNTLPLPIESHHKNTCLNSKSCQINTFLETTTTIFCKEKKKSATNRYTIIASENVLSNKLKIICSLPHNAHKRC